MQPRPPKPRDPARCDPADATQHAAYAPVEHQLSIDDRIRNVVRAMVGNLGSANEPELTADDLRQLEALVPPDSPMSPYQILDEARPERDLDRFLQTLTADEVEDVKAFLETVKRTAPPEGTPGAGAPDNAAAPAPPTEPPA